MYNKNFFKSIKLIDLSLKRNAADGVILNLIKKRVYEEYFFSVVFSEVWFFPLKKRGYFNPKNNPTPVL